MPNGPYTGSCLAGIKSHLAVSHMRAQHFILIEGRDGAEQAL
jgi:hypothetical protein